MINKSTTLSSVYIVCITSYLHIKQRCIDDAPCLTLQVKQTTYTTLSTQTNRRPWSSMVWTPWLRCPISSEWHCRRCLLGPKLPWLRCYWPVREYRLRRTYVNLICKVVGIQSMIFFDFKVDEAEIIPYLGLIFGMKTWSEGSKTIYHLKARNVSFRMVYGFAILRQL